jgi:hypothetical protein
VSEIPWFKVDDKLHDHHKARAAGKSAMGVWVLAGSWAMDNLTDGFVPAGVLARWGTRRDAEALVSAGFWQAHTRHGEAGWKFRDWTHYQPSARDVKAAAEAKGQSGSLGNHKRWHLRRGVNDPECVHCQEAEK